MSEQRTLHWLARPLPRSRGEGRTSGLASLKIRNYRLYTIGQTISVAGNWMQNIAVGWLTLELTILTYMSKFFSSVDNKSGPSLRCTYRTGHSSTMRALKHASRGCTLPLALAERNRSER